MIGSSLVVMVVLTHGIGTLLEGLGVDTRNGFWPVAVPALVLDVGFIVALRIFLVKKVPFRNRNTQSVDRAAVYAPTFVVGDGVAHDIFPVQGPDANAVSQETERSNIPRQIPPEFRASEGRRLRVNERVFSKQRGEGVIVAGGPNRHFVRVRFEEDGTEAEVEAFGLFHQT